MKRFSGGSLLQNILQLNLSPLQLGLYFLPLEKGLVTYSLEKIKIHRLFKIIYEDPWEVKIVNLSGSK